MSISMLWEILEYRLTTSKDTIRVYLFIVLGTSLRLSILICLRNGLKRVSKKLLKRWVLLAGPAIRGLNLKSLRLWALIILYLVIY